jgi:transposase
MSHAGLASAPRCPIECPIRSQVDSSANEKIPLECGISDGETGLESGTPRFSVVRPSRLKLVSLQEIPWLLATCTASTFSPTLRRFPRRYGRWRGSSAFSLVAMAILIAGGAAPHVGCSGARLRRRSYHSVIADRGYDHDRYRRELWRRGVKPVIARRSTDHGSGLGRVRWMVERTFAWLHNFRRLGVRWERDAGPHYALLSLGCSRDLRVPHPIVRHGRGRCSYARRSRPSPRRSRERAGAADIPVSGRPVGVPLEPERSSASN